MEESEWTRRCEVLIEKPSITPGRGRVLIARQPRSGKQGSVIIPEAAKEQSQLGIVVALGPKRENLMGSEVDYWVSLGDTVLINQYAGKPLGMEGLELTIFEEGDIVARVVR